MKRPAELLPQSDGSETVEWAIILGILVLVSVGLILALGSYAMEVFQELADHAAGES